ncbi:potassium channel subfamily K member 15 isoform X1 [Diprion similis]|uniref:potassium channel subfamily K member 15 isoform X1 n=1 Tax=Diprion similis TaxID=362088 RepID=UPI001EF8DBE7|nr:potassium channel subfamily K member 15 isoform X1 [Diprion similis]
MHAGDHSGGRNGSGGYYHKTCCPGRSTDDGHGAAELLCCCCTCTASASPSLLTSLGVCIFVLAYTLVGAFTFMAVEGGLQSDSSAVISSKSGPEEAAALSAEIRSLTVEKLWSITEDLNILYKDNWTRLAAQEILDFQNTLVHTLRKQLYQALPATTGQHPTRHHRWTFSSSLLYSLTLITTTGYSNVVPKTLWGRLISIIYALTGIPLLLVYLSTVGDVLARSFGRLYGRLCRPRSCTRKPSKAYHNHVDSKSGGNYYPSKDSSCDDLGRAGSVVLLDCGSEGLQAASSSTALDPSSKGHLHHGFHHRLPCPKAVRIPITLCLLIIIAYICGGAVLFNRLEGWSLLESSYFCFTSLGTIGFGDLVPGGAAAPSAILEELSLCATSLYILLGMGLIAMCFNLVQEQVLHVVRAVGRFCGMGGGGSAEGPPDCRGPGAPDDEGIPMSVVSAAS